MILSSTPGIPGVKQPWIVILEKKMANKIPPDSALHLINNLLKTGMNLCNAWIHKISSQEPCRATWGNCKMLQKLCSPVTTEAYTHSSKEHQRNVSHPTLANPSQYPQHQISTPRRNHALKSSDTTTLFVGDSIIWDVRNKRIKTVFSQGYCIWHHGKYPLIETNKIIVHAGSNDFPKQQSEILKQVFLHLLDCFNSTLVKVMHFDYQAPFPQSDGDATNLVGC